MADEKTLTARAASFEGARAPFCVHDRLGFGESDAARKKRKSVDRQAVERVRAGRMPIATSDRGGVPPFSASVAE